MDRIPLEGYHRKSEKSKHNSRGLYLLAAGMCKESLEEYHQAIRKTKSVDLEVLKEAIADLEVFKAQKSSVCVIEDTLNLLLLVAKVREYTSEGTQSARFSQLGRELLPGEVILLDEDAAHRFGWLGVHLNCRVILTNKRLMFQDRDRDQDSFDLSIDDLRQATFGKRFDTDLVIRLVDGHKYEIGLETGQWQRLMKGIKEITGANGIAC